MTTTDQSTSDSMPGSSSTSRTSADGPSPTRHEDEHHTPSHSHSPSPSHSRSDSPTTSRPRSRSRSESKFSTTFLPPQWGRSILDLTKLLLSIPEQSSSKAGPATPNTPKLKLTRAEEEGDYLPYGELDPHPFVGGEGGVYGYGEYSRSGSGSGDLLQPPSSKRTSPNMSRISDDHDYSQSLNQFQGARAIAQGNSSNSGIATGWGTPAPSRPTTAYANHVRYFALPLPDVDAMGLVESASTARTSRYIQYLSTDWDTYRSLRSGHSRLIFLQPLLTQSATEPLTSSLVPADTHLAVDVDVDPALQVAQQADPAGSAGRTAFAKNHGRWEISPDGEGVPACKCEKIYNDCPSHPPFYGHDEPTYSYTSRRASQDSTAGAHALQEGESNRSRSRSQVQVQENDMGNDNRAPEVREQTELPMWGQQCWRQRGDNYWGLCDTCSSVQKPWAI